MRQPLFDQYAPIPGLLITSAICYTLLGLRLSDYRGSEEAVEWTKNHRTLVTIIVQILSHSLGMMHVLIICKYLFQRQKVAL